MKLVNVNAQKPAGNKAVAAYAVAISVFAAFALSACKSTPPAPAPAASGSRPAPAPAPAPAPVPSGVSSSNAATERDYRKDGARHIYAKHGGKVFKGMLPPNIPAVGVVNVSLDSRGNVTNISWARRPSDESFMSVTEGLIRIASPFPAPTRLGKVVYTDIWLWDKSGMFQLDTLTEGQRRE